MNDLRNLTCVDILNNTGEFEKVLRYYSIFPNNNKFYYNYNTIYEDIYSIDVSAFNLQFLKYINRFIKSPNIDSYISMLHGFDKNNRVVEFGYLYKDLKIDIPLTTYMVAFRNIIFLHFFKIMEMSPRNLQLYRLNYDDVEFTTLESDITTDLYIHKHFLNIVKIIKFDYVFVLNKEDGVYYIKDNEIVNIKYTSGWVNIPAYKFIINEIVKFILNNDTIENLNNILNNYMEYADNSDFFGYQDDDISKSYKPDDIIPMSVKYLFIAKVMSKFSILFK